MTVPKLRFKEFDEDWMLTTLNQLSTKIGDGIHATPKYDESGTIPFINGNNLVNGRIAINENTKRISSEEFQKYNQILSDRTLFLSINGTIGNLAFYKNEKVLLGKSVCFINLKNDLDKKFIYLLLQSPQLTKTLNSELTGTTIKNLSLATVRNSEFYCPIKAEQTKIASFLSAVDEKISQLTQKHELLSQYKQGMMQKLFSQQIRFKADDGSEFGEWEKVKLGSLLIKHDEKTEFNNQYPVLTSSRHGIYFQKDYFAGQDVASADTTGYNVVPYDYFTYRHMSDDLVFKFNINTICPKGIVSTLYPVFTVKDEHLNKYFLQTILNEGQEFKNFAIMQKQGGSRTYMYFSKLSELVLTIPCLEEQTKIANFLSSIDQKIEVVAQQIEQAKQWKKGLLQQMFV
ncbi:restriction endonuclease subunit S [Acinetobacter sp.]|uniref:restriction endonuclease subunit S n=1 Tax=Acinetobacter sp. TaxID=472 RepID=UPI0035B2CC44